MGHIWLLLVVCYLYLLGFTRLNFSSVHKYIWRNHVRFHKLLKFMSKSFRLSKSTDHVLHRSSGLCWILNPKWIIKLKTQSNLFNTHVFLIFNVKFSANHTSLKYKCFIKINNKNEPLTLSIHLSRDYHTLFVYLFLINPLRFRLISIWAFHAFIEFSYRSLNCRCHQ